MTSRELLDELLKAELRQLRIRNLAAQDKLIAEAREKVYAVQPERLRRRALQRCARARREAHLAQQTGSAGRSRCTAPLPTLAAAAARTAPQESLALLRNIGRTSFLTSAPPKLLIHGLYDDGHPIASEEPIFRLMREPKRRVALVGGHMFPPELTVPVVNAFLDETLGPVSRK
jgi:hypothetical protein